MMERVYAWEAGGDSESSNERQRRPSVTVTVTPCSNDHSDRDSNSDGRGDATSSKGIASSTITGTTPGVRDAHAAGDCEHTATIWTVTLHRPHARNAVDGPTAAALAAAFRDFDADPAARVAVLYGSGGTFCAGADLKAFATGDPAKHNAITRVGEGDGPMGPTRMLLGKPVIAAIAGHAVAGGLELAAWADLRVAEEDAVLGVFCRRFGVPLIDGGTVRLPRLIGLSRAMDLIRTCQVCLLRAA